MEAGLRRTVTAHECQAQNTKKATPQDGLFAETDQPNQPILNVKEPDAEFSATLIGC